MSTTIYRRDGTVAFVAETATTMREAAWVAAKARAYLTRANLSRVRAGEVRAVEVRAVGVYYATIGPIDGWMVALALTTEGLRISAGCRYFSFPEAREHWSDPSRWSSGASPEHGARMLAAVNALLDLAADWPEKLPEVAR